MQYTAKDQLTIVELDKEERYIPMARLAEVISLSPSNTIYFRKDGKLYGIISMGDIKRASHSGLGFVDVNVDFTYVLLGEYMKARYLFHTKKNINAIPVLDTDGNLVGEYSRWSDLLQNGENLRGGGERIPMWQWFFQTILSKRRSWFIKPFVNVWQLVG